MTVKEATVERLLQICNSKGLVPNALANLSGVTPSTVYSVIDPERKDVSIRTLKKLCDGLEVSLREFFNSELFDSLSQEIF